MESSSLSIIGCGNVLFVAAFTSASSALLTLIEVEPLRRLAFRLDFLNRGLLSVNDSDITNIIKLQIKRKVLGTNNMKTVTL